LSPRCPFKLGPRALAQLLDDFIFHNLSVFHVAKGLRFAALSFCLRNPVRYVAVSNIGYYKGRWSNRKQRPATAAPVILQEMRTSPVLYKNTTSKVPFCFISLFIVTSFLCLPDDASQGATKMETLLDASACRRASAYCSSMKNFKTPAEIVDALGHARNLDQLNSALALCLHQLALGKRCRM